MGPGVRRIGRCLWGGLHVLDGLRADVTLDAASWAEVAQAVAPLLTEHGFGEPVDGDGIGGWLSISAQDPSGAVLELRAKGLTDGDVDRALVTTDEECALPAQ